MVEQAMALGLTGLCFTEHMDMDYPVQEEGGPDFLLDTAAYIARFDELQKEYGSRITLRMGVELGLQPHQANRLGSYASSHPFDFIIGSSHLVHGFDPYYPAYYQGRTEEEAYREYFTSILENIRAFTDFDVYGHLDYVVRYGPNKDTCYTYEQYRDILDEILLALIGAGKGIELNTGGLKSGLRDVHPCTAVLKRYRQLGGEIITVGSDAHRPGNLADSFCRAEAVLKDCGFSYYTVFQHRQPEFIRLT
jgi:histidinol-phosphatase (PHP family)